MEDSLEGLIGTGRGNGSKVLSPLVLAYIGDACFELYIRKRIVQDNIGLPPRKLHLLTVGYVSASSQSDIIHGIWDSLKECEKAVVKKGRNAKSGMAPKNADIVQYRHATGFEALIGYLFLRGDTNRLCNVLDRAYEFLSSVNNFRG